MKTAGVIICSLLILAFAIGPWRRSSGVRDRDLATSSASLPHSAQLQAELGRTREALASGRYDRALVLARDGYESASRQGRFDLAVRFLGNQGMAQFGLHRFNAALQCYLQAHTLAVRHRQNSAAGLITAAIASLYVQLGERNAAAEWLQKCAAELSGPDRVRHLPEVQIQLASLRASQGRLPEALALFSTAIDAADRNGDLQLCALGWNRVGEEFLSRREFPAAERALLEAYRIRKLNHLPLDTSYLNLGQLRLAQGDYTSALAVLDRNVELASGLQGAWPTWKAYYFRGKVHLAKGDLTHALADLRVAVRLARAWRWSSPGEDAIRIGNEGMLQVVYSALIEAGNRLYQQNGDPALLRETLDAAEENRAVSLQAFISDPKASVAAFPAAYWETVNQLQRAEVEALRQPSAKTGSRVATLRAELVRMEAGSGSASSEVVTELTRQIQPLLPPDTALLAFHLGAARSWLWALERNRLILYSLPAQGEIAAAMESLRQSMRGRLADAPQRSAQVYQMLFGNLDESCRSRARWLLVLDAELFRVPFAALREDQAGRVRYLAESRMIQVIPGAAMLLQQEEPYDYSHGAFMGVSDPIYNLADPRYIGERPVVRTAATVPLARLVSSAAEIELCARAFSSRKPILRSGGEASRTGISDALRQGPAVLHFAAHFLQSSQQQGYALMALSLGPQGTTEVVTPYEIARWHTSAGLVVLSGCSSAGGAALPGTGLLGLTRAWLAAGAREVVASHWATPDDSGALFQSLYHHLRTNPTRNSANALLLAQQEMIHTSGWRSNPAYWGAYFVFGRP